MLDLLQLVQTQGIGAVEVHTDHVDALPRLAIGKAMRLQQARVAERRELAHQRCGAAVVGQIDPAKDG